MNVYVRALPSWKLCLKLLLNYLCLIVVYRVDFGTLKTKYVVPACDGIRKI